MTKVSAENPKRFKTLEKNFKPQTGPLDTHKVVLTNSWRFLAESLKNFRSKVEKSLKKKIRKLFLPNFYSGHIYTNLRTMPKVSAENPKRFKTLEKNFKPKIVPLDTQKVVLTTFWKFFGRKSEKFFSQNPKKFWKEKSENSFFRNFFSGHVDRHLRTKPKVSAENPKRFKIF